MRKVNLEDLITMYVESKKDSWSESSQRSERYRLRGIKLELLTQPKELWDYLLKERGLKPYAAKVAFIRAGEMLEFAMTSGYLENGPNVLKQWMAKHGNKFKNLHHKKPVGITFDEAMRRIKSYDDKGVREKALQLLATGMRAQESTTLDENGQVERKGGGKRTIPGGMKYKANNFDRCLGSLRYHLKKIGLTPHDLRRLCATKMAELGATEADLMAMFGWRSSSMAAHYIQAQREKQLTAKMAEAIEPNETKGDHDDRE